LPSTVSTSGAGGTGGGDVGGAITPHTIRKTAITLAIAHGASPKAVASRVGHADSRVTLDIYSSITESMDDALLDIITGIVPQGDGGKTA